MPFFRQRDTPTSGGGGERGEWPTFSQGKTSAARKKETTCYYRQGLNDKRGTNSLFFLSNTRRTAD